MPLDPSIALQVQSPNPLNTISGFLDIGNKQQALKKARATFDADVAQRNADAQTSQAQAQVATANVNPLIAQQAAQTENAQAQAKSQQLKTLRDYVTNARQSMQPLYNNPEATPEMLQDAVYQTLKNSGAPTEAYGQAFANLPKKGASQKELQKYITDSLLQSQDIATHLDKIAPAPAMVNTGAAFQPVAQGNEQLTGVAPGTPVGVATPNQISPQAQEEIQTDAQGNRYIVQRSPQGAILATRPVPGSTTGGQAPEQPGGVPAGPVNLPPNETPQTRDALQAERTAANQAIAQVGPMRNANQEIARLADSDLQTGKLGALRNRIASATGYNLGKDDAADYNTLGKMLARSNATLAQSMGPHTNAGLAQANEANGTQEYDKTTLKKIANLNDALLTGTQLYQQGLENAIKQNGIFGKRQFDQQWSQAMDVDALRLKNAVDNGNKGEVQMILKTVGGQGSAGAKTLFNKLTKIDALAGQQ